MRRKYLALIAVPMLLISLLAGACTSTKTITVSAPGKSVTITAPGLTTTLPAVTVTLPGKVTTIPATSVSLPPITTVLPPQPTDVGPFLPTTPITITTHQGLMDSLAGDCLTCHGPTAYIAFPTAPSWDGANNNSDHNIGFYYVAAGSIQDHTNRTATQCLGCHAVA